MSKAKNRDAKKQLRILLFTAFLLCLALIVSIGYGIAHYGAEPAVTDTQAVVTPAPKPSPPTRAELLALVNQERAKYGVAPLTEDPRLDQSAQEKADDMVNNNYYSHYRNNVFVGQQFIDQTGISCPTDGENITKGTVNEPNTANNDMKAWTNSPEHENNIINPKYTLVGFGVAGQYAVQHFCQP